MECIVQQKMVFSYYVKKKGDIENITLFLFVSRPILMNLVGRKGCKIKKNEDTHYHCGMQLSK